MAGLVELLSSAIHKVSDSDENSGCEEKIKREFSVDNFLLSDGSTLFKDGLTDFKKIEAFNGKVRVDERLYVEYVGEDGIIQVFNSQGASHLEILQLNTEGSVRRIFKWAPTEEKPSDRMGAIEVVDGDMHFERYMYLPNGRSRVFVEGDVEENTLVFHLGSDYDLVNIKYIDN